MLGNNTSNKLISRPLWYHKFSIQPEVKLGSSSIDFFPGFVAVFLTTNSKCRPLPALDAISLLHYGGCRGLFLVSPLTSQHKARMGETASYTAHTRRFQCVNLFGSVYLSRACGPPCVCMGISLSFYMCACVRVCVWTYICVFLVCSDGSQQFPVYLAS